MIRIFEYILIACLTAIWVEHFLEKDTKNKLVEQKLHYEHIILSKEQECEAKVTRMLMQKCAEEEMPAGGGMVLSWYSNADHSATHNIEIQELPPEWGIGDVELDGKEDK